MGQLGSDPKWEVVLGFHGQRRADAGEGEEWKMRGRKPGMENGKWEEKCEEGDLNPHGFYPTSPSN